MEKCVLCHKETNVSRNLDISKRSYYVEAVGQLCKECYKKTYKS